MRLESLETYDAQVLLLIKELIYQEHFMKGEKAFF